MSKIFISIPSFRDPTLEATMRIALKNADNPDSVIFGIGAQYYEDEMPSFDFVKKNQLKLLSWHPDERPGVVRVRHEISKLITDEEYFMSIDSHMLFRPHWDTIAIEWLKELQNKTNNKLVCITNGCAWGDEVQSSRQIIVKIVSPTNIEPGGLSDAKLSKIDGWLQAQNVTANFFFTPIEAMTEVGWDPYSQFCWEEQYMTFRLFMSGFDCFIPANDFIIKQSPDFYFYYVWPDRSKHYWTRENNRDSQEHDYQLQRAMTKNEPDNKFSIKNPKRGVREFWEILGQGKLYDKIMESDSDLNGT